MHYYARVQRSFRGAGLSGLLSSGVRYAYRNLLRPLLPVAGYVRFNGTKVNRPIKIGDPRLPVGWVPYPISDVADYESALVAGLQEHVRSGDKVLVVGGGWGVTAVVAAAAAGSGGVVHCYEGSAQRVSDIRRAATLNGVAGQLFVHHAIVAQGIAIDGESAGTPIVAADSLPASDVVELDCEGAEIQILREMTFRPRVILVESHGVYGAPTTAVVKLLEELDYRVVRTEIAEAQMDEFCRKNDIFVTVAIRGDQDGA